jgi:hypothetical protein
VKLIKPKFCIQCNAQFPDHSFYYNRAVYMLHPHVSVQGFLDDSSILPRHDSPHYLLSSLVHTSIIWCNEHPILEKSSWNTQKWIKQSYLKNTQHPHWRITLDQPFWQLCPVNYSGSNYDMWTYSTKLPIICWWVWLEGHHNSPLVGKITNRKKNI